MPWAEKRWTQDRYLDGVIGDPWGNYFAGESGVPAKVRNTINTYSDADCVLGFHPFFTALSAWWLNENLNRPDCAVGLPDGPGACGDFRSWETLGEGPAFSISGNDPSREWAELAYYFTDLAAPAGTVPVPAFKTNVNGNSEELGIGGTCLRPDDWKGGVHSAFAAKPIQAVWGFWSRVATELKDSTSQ